jgi:hypothetical protein
MAYPAFSDFNFTFADILQKIKYDIESRSPFQTAYRQ